MIKLNIDTKIIKNSKKQKIIIGEKGKKYSYLGIGVNPLTLEIERQSIDYLPSISKPEIEKYIREVENRTGKSAPELIKSSKKIYENIRNIDSSIYFNKNSLIYSPHVDTVVASSFLGVGFMKFLIGDPYVGTSFSLTGSYLLYKGLKREKEYIKVKREIENILDDEEINYSNIREFSSYSNKLVLEI